MQFKDLHCSRNKSTGWEKMPAKRFPKRCPKGVPQCLQNELCSPHYSEVANVTVGEGTVERVLSRNTIAIVLEDNTEALIRLFKVNHENEAYYWEAEQALHQMLASQKVYFISLGVEPPNTLLADVYLPSGQSATEMLIRYGLASLERCLNLPKKQLRYLKQIENKARAAKRGIWGLNHKNPSKEKLYINKLLFKNIRCMVYKIDDVDSINMAIMPDNFHINVSISASLNVLNRKKLKRIAIKYLLYKQVKLKLQNYDICANRFNGTIVHPEFMELNDALQENRNMNIIHTPTFVASVIEVLNGNAFTLRIRNRVIKNVFLSYITFPWECEDMKHLCCKEIHNLKLVSMYYTHRLRTEAREFLRTLLVGSNVQVTVDYLDSCGRVYCTMIAFEMNIATVLIEEGYASADIDCSACPHRQEYLVARNKAKKCKVGMHGLPQQLQINVAWCMDNVLQLLKILKKQRKVNVVMEQVLSPSYIILFSVELRWLFAFSLIDFEEVRRTKTGVSNNSWKEMVTRMIADMCLQKQVSLRATSVDCNGVFHGNLHLGRWNLKMLLLKRIMRHRVRLPRHRKQALPVLRKRKRVVISIKDAAQMQRIKQLLRRDVKTLASIPVSFSPSSQYFISNRKKRSTVTVNYHFEQPNTKTMTIKQPSIQVRNIRKKRGKKNKENAPQNKCLSQETEEQNMKMRKKRGKKNKENAPQNKCLSQETEEQNMKMGRKRTKRKQCPKKDEQIKDNVVQNMIAAVRQQQANNVLKKKSKETNSVTLRWCCF